MIQMDKWQIVSATVLLILSLLLAPSGGVTRSTATLTQRLEANAGRRLAEIEANAGSRAHFVSRHGAQTTLEQQFTRATTGLTPDGKAFRPVDASRFLDNRSQLNAVQAAEEIFGRTGRRVFSFDAGSTIGEGFSRGGSNLFRTTNVRAVFDTNGNLRTLFPLLSPLP